MEGMSAGEQEAEIITERVMTVEQHIAPKQAILIVEDSTEDYEATLRVLRKCGLWFQIAIVPKDSGE